MGVMETRQGYFDQWAAALQEERWSDADTCTVLLLHTLEDEHNDIREPLQSFIEKVNSTANHERDLLAGLIHSERHPFRREEMKMKNMEISSWRGYEIHRVFLMVFMSKKLIVVER